MRPVLRGQDRSTGSDAVAAEDLEAVAAVTDDHTAVIEDVVADKGYHSIRSYWI